MIGILTFHETINFGSYLQAVALPIVLGKMGVDCEILNYHCDAILKRERISELASKKSLKDYVSYIRHYRFYHIKKKKYDSLRAFLYRNVRVSEDYDQSNIDQAERRYDKIIVGSDIVWGLDITENDYTYFLDFVKDRKKKYAFSSSLGTEPVDEAKQKIVDLLNGFEYIAVREKDSCDWLNENLSITTDFVCDPTMLLTAEEWDRVIQPKRYGDKYVLVYFGDDTPKCIADAKEYAKKHGCKVKIIRYVENNEDDCISEKPTSLREFVGLIKHAEMVFTGSYHGMLYSIYYNKQFLFYNRAHKSRMLSVACMLGVERNCGDSSRIDQYTEIDYDNVNAKVNAFRNESMTKLQMIANSP